MAFASSLKILDNEILRVTTVIRNELTAPVAHPAGPLSLMSSEFYAAIQ